MTQNHFNKQVALLLDILPFLNFESDLALKGGTAINLFHQDMPRLSVDIDLTYLPLKPRKETLRHIHTILQALIIWIKQRFPHITIQDVSLPPHNLTKQIICHTKGIHIKIEINTVLRGTLFPTEERTLCDHAQKLFSRSMKIKTLSTEDLYGGKICAALDRQHPRDLFDIYLLFKASPVINSNLKQAFLFYLLSHNRPMSELLNPRLKDIADLYKYNFEGMNYEPVHLDDLYQTRLDLIRAVNTSFTDQDKEFLISFKRGDPNWHLSNAESFQAYPSIQWKLHNVRSMTPSKHTLDLDNLITALG